MLPHKKITILVVDDELSIREAFSDWLKQDGYEVETAADGLVALAKIKERHYDIMLVDVKMPQMDGITLLKTLEGERSRYGRGDDDGPRRHPGRRGSDEAGG